MTLPLSVPNLGLSLLAVVVRTKSTTGTPRRQMVTGSPSSAAFISWGSLFLAFATLTFIGSYYSHLDSYVNNRRVLTDALQDIRSACVDSPVRAASCNWE